jgi:multidrug resistance efflux pump
MRGKRLLIWGTLALLAVAAGTVGMLSMLRRHRDPPPPKPAAAAPSPVAAGEVLLTGKVRARNVVGIGATVQGNVEVFLAEIGQEVEEGQVLARIANPGLETGRELASLSMDNAQARVVKVEAALTAARLEASRAAADASRARDDLDRAEKNYRRQMMLNREGATPRLTFEKSSAEFDNSRGEYDGLAKLAKQAELRIQTLLDELQNARKIYEDKQKQLDFAVTALSDAEVRSPVAGTVVSRKGEVGKSGMEQGGELFQIATDTLELEVFLEPDPPTVKRIKPGQDTLVIISDMRDEPIPGKVANIENGNVLVDFTSPDPAIKPGFLAQVRIRVE